MAASATLLHFRALRETGPSTCGSPWVVYWHILPFMGYVVIMHNLVCGSLWTWRILIGPLNFEVAEFEGSNMDSVNQ